MWTTVLRQAVRRVARPAVSTLALLIVLTAPAPAVEATRPAEGAPAPAAPAQEAGSLTYRLADHWTDVPWELTPGRYGHAADISTAPAGPTYVLDAFSKAVHVLDLDGTPRRAFRVPTTPDAGADWQVERLDAHPDGTVSVLSLGRFSANGISGRVDRFAPDGTRLSFFETATLNSTTYVDIAVRADGRIYLVRRGPDNPFIDWPGPSPTPPPDGAPATNAVDVHDPDGIPLESIHPPEMHIPDGADVDLETDMLYVINRVPVPFNNQPPGATPTPRPSGSQPYAGEPYAAPPAQGPGDPPVNGVMVFEPDHTYVETVEFNDVEDVAAGPAGVFISRNIEIFRLRETRPLYSGPTGRVYSAYFGEVVFHLTVPADGRLQASMFHCYFQGVLTIDDPAAEDPQPQYKGALDRPPLEGPIYPLRMDFGARLAVMGGRYAIEGTPSEPRYVGVARYGEPQTIQQWSADGRPVAQIGLCAGSESWWARDVAADGSDVYAIDSEHVQLRPDDRLPAWRYWPSITLDIDETTRLSAVAADDGRAVVLDTAQDAVWVMSRDGTLEGRWPLGAEGASALPVDLALDGQRVYVADAGRGRVLVRDLNGADLGSWSLHDGPLGLAIGPAGDVFVLGRGGWGFRYRPDGTLVSSWPLPDRTQQFRDLAVDDDGRVYVGHYREREIEPPDGVFYWSEQFEILDAGIWVFEPAVAEPAPPPEPGACVTWRDKQASPARIPLGDEIDVTLDVTGRCPGEWDPTQIMLVIDTSRSMGFTSSLSRGQDVLQALLGRLDAGSAEIGLVTFDDAGTLVQPLTDDLSAVRAAVAALTPEGDSRMAAGIDAARAELTGPRRDPEARQTIVIVSDGVYKDAPLEAAEDARAAGLDLYVLLFPTLEFNNGHYATLSQMTGDEALILRDPTADDVVALGLELINYRPQAGLFEQVTVTDYVPENMTYVPDSAQPRAEWNPDRRTLTWRFGTVLADDALRMRYRLEPQEVGLWPTNTRALAAYRDALDNLGTIVFPIPEVEVYEGQTYTIYLPFATKGACLRRTVPLDIALAIDTSSSMQQPAPGGGTKLEAAVAAATGFVELLDLPRDRAAIVSFNAGAQRVVELTGDGAALAAGLARLQSARGTRIDLGLEAAGAALDAARPQATPVVVLLSDGRQAAGDNAAVLAAADALKARGALVYTIGLGDDADAALLGAAATSPDRYYHSPTEAELATIYQQISVRLECVGP